MTKTTRVEIIGQYTFTNAFDADRGEVDVIIDRQPASFLNDAPSPPNWNSFCDAVDAALVPFTEGKKFYVTVGQQSYSIFLISLILSVLEYIVLDTEWFNKIIGTLGLWTFLPFGTMFLSTITHTFISFVFMFKHDKWMAELVKVSSEYSDHHHGIRYEVGFDYQDFGRERRLVCFYMLVHVDENSQIDVEDQPMDVRAMTNEGSPAGDAGDTINREKYISSAPPTFEYNLM